MTAATPGPSGPSIFSMFSAEGNGLYRTKRESFVVSLLGQAAIVGLLVYFTSCVIQSTPPIAQDLHKLKDFALVFSGGGGNFDKVPASHGDLPPASLREQFSPPTVIVPKEMPRLPMPETVVAPEVKLTQGGVIGDPMSKFSLVPSNGSGGPTGIGTGCCGGVGDSAGPGFGSGPQGVFTPGRLGVTVPQVIFNPEPSFSEEARKAKAQGVVMVLLVVGQDGHTYNVHVGQSAGMGLDEKAVEAVSRWRFKPATFNGRPVATQIAVEVDFHLY